MNKHVDKYCRNMFFSMSQHAIFYCYIKAWVAIHVVKACCIVNFSQSCLLTFDSRIEI